MTKVYQTSDDPEWTRVTDLDFPLEAGHQIKEVLETIGYYGYVACGADRWLMVDNSPLPGDIDVFLREKGHGSDVLTALEDIGYVYHSGPSRAPKFHMEAADMGQHLLVQVIVPDEEHDARPSFGSPRHVLGGFTFTTEQAAVWYSDDDEGIRGLFSLNCWTHTEAKQLVFNNLSNPILAAYRVNKYGQKGYSIPMEQILELAYAFRNFPIDQFGKVILDALSMQS